MSSYADKIGEFNKAIADIGRELAEVETRRKAHSLAAAQGDQRAVKEIESCTQLAADLHRRTQTLHSAIETCRALERSAEQREEAKQRNERAIKARQHADAAAALNTEIDHMFVQLRQAFERRSALLCALTETGCVDWATINKVGSKNLAAASACYHGLSRWLPIERTATASFRPLSDSNQVLIGVGPKSDKSA